MQGDEAPNPDAFPYRRFPCACCPIRADNVDNPAAKFPAWKWDELQASVPEGHGGASVPVGTLMFGCHAGLTPGSCENGACAGWLAVFGADHVTVRLAVTLGRLAPEALQPGANWPPLHQDWASVREHQTLKPGDSTGHLGDMPLDQQEC